MPGHGAGSMPLLVIELGHRCLTRHGRSVECRMTLPTRAAIRRFLTAETAKSILRSLLQCDKVRVPDIPRRCPTRSRHEALRRLHRRRRPVAGDRAGRVLLPARTVRLWQDDHAAHDRRLRGGGLGTVYLGDAGRDRSAALQARREHRLPELRPLPAPVGLRERRLRPAPRRRCRQRDRDARSAPCSSWWSFPATSSASRRSSPAASSSAWRWRGRSSTTHACSSSTSRSARSTSSCASRCRSS